MSERNMKDVVQKALDIDCADVNCVGYNCSECPLTVLSRTVDELFKSPLDEFIKRVADNDFSEEQLRTIAKEVGLCEEQ